jgi:1-acyl-sn-glycerol-3-phosphate acyltransferase
MKKEVVKKYARASRRAALAVTAVPVAVGLSALQGFVIGPLTRNYETVPKMMHATMRRMFGYKIEFNAASAPLVNDKDKKVWFVANHMSVADFIVVGSALDGSFVGKGEIMKWPVISQMAKAAKFMGVRRRSEYNEESRGKIVQNFNAGFNTIMFPEGTISDGKQVHLFRAALLGLLFGEKATDKKKKEVALKEKVVVQPIAIRVKSVNGKDATGDDALRALYSMSTEHNPLRRIWKRMQVKQITLELTAFPPLDPANFNDAKALANEAASNIASVVNPGQGGFVKKPIAGHDIPKK